MKPGIYTNDAGNLGKALSREVSHATAVGALDSGPAVEQAQQPSHDHGQTMAMER